MEGGHLTQRPLSRRITRPRRRGRLSINQPSFNTQMDCADGAQASCGGRNPAGYAAG